MRWFDRKTCQWGVCLWPGLPRLWHDGSWLALSAAVAFGVVLNALLVVTLVWYELAPMAMKSVGWTVVFGVWFVSAVVSFRALPRGGAANSAKTPEEGGQDLYPAALNEYLKRNFVAAERLLEQLLRRNERDCAAGLMLATLWRRTSRPDDARRELERMSRLEAGGDWRREIEHELRLLSPDELTPANASGENASKDRSVEGEVGDEGDVGKDSAAQPNQPGPPDQQIKAA